MAAIFSSRLAWHIRHLETKDVKVRALLGEDYYADVLDGSRKQRVPRREEKEIP
jgi:hypothetical protein